MAFSKSLQKGQIALSCQMCEESREIKWKRMTCDSLMCTKCCRIHRKFKSSEKHDIVDLKDIAHHSAESGTNLDFANITCSQHKDQKCCLYCEVCEEVVCPMCIAKVHNNTHKMVEIGEGYPILLSKIKNVNSEIEKDILKFTTDVSKLDSIKDTERSNYLIQKEKILSQEKAVKDAVEKHTKKLLGDLDQKWKILENTLKDEEKHAIKVVKDLEGENEVITQAMDSKDASQVFKIASEGKLKRQNQEPVNTKYQRLPQFVPGEINPSSVESIHGTLEEIEEQHVEQNFQIQVKEQFTTTLSGVHSIECCNDGNVWICDSNIDKIQKVKLLNGSVHVNNIINSKCFGMALTPTGDLLLSTADTYLQIIPYTTEKLSKTKFGVSPLETTAVHASHNTIIVGAKEIGSTYPGNEQRQVVVMDMKERHEPVYQYEKKKKPLFTYPYKITTDKDNNIYVIDQLSDDWNGRVVVLEQGGGVRGIYTGHPDINDTAHSFKPVDLVTIPSNNVIVSDIYNNTLHILNNNVQCVQYLNTKHLGIEWPDSLCFDNKGLLYIGCDDTIGKPCAKIHVVELVKSIP